MAILTTTASGTLPTSICWSRTLWPVEHLPTSTLTGDGGVDNQDVDQWLIEAGSINLASGGAYLRGDANLDGLVDGQDFVTWNLNKFTTSAAWSQGDFDVNGLIDGNDFIVWNINKFQLASPPATPGDTLAEAEDPFGDAPFWPFAAHDHEHDHDQFGHGDVHFGDHSAELLPDLQAVDLRAAVTGGRLGVNQNAPVPGLASVGNQPASYQNRASETRAIKRDTGSLMDHAQFVDAIFGSLG